MKKSIEFHFFYFILQKKGENKVKITISDKIKNTQTRNVKEVFAKNPLNKKNLTKEMKRGILNVAKIYKGKNEEIMKSLPLFIFNLKEMIYNLEELQLKELFNSIIDFLINQGKKIKLEFKCENLINQNYLNVLHAIIEKCNKMEVFFEKFVINDKLAVQAGKMKINFCDKRIVKMEFDDILIGLNKKNIDCYKENTFLLTRFIDESGFNGFMINQTTNRVGLHKAKILMKFLKNLLINIIAKIKFLEIPYNQKCYKFLNTHNGDGLTLLSLWYLNYQEKIEIFHFYLGLQQMKNITKIKIEKSLFGNDTIMKMLVNCVRLESITFKICVETNRNSIKSLLDFLMLHTKLKKISIKTNDDEMLWGLHQTNNVPVWECIDYLGNQKIEILKIADVYLAGCEIERICDRIIKQQTHVRILKFKNVAIQEDKTGLIIKSVEAANLEMELLKMDFSVVEKDNYKNDVYQLSDFAKLKVKEITICSDYFLDVDFQSCLKMINYNNTMKSVHFIKPFFYGGGGGTIQFGTDILEKAQIYGQFKRKFQNAIIFSKKVLLNAKWNLKLHIAYGDIIDIVVTTFLLCCKIITKKKMKIPKFINYYILSFIEMGSFIKQK